MGGAGDAGIIIADRLLAAPFQRLVLQFEVRRHHQGQIAFDDLLVLGGGRNDAGELDGTVGGNLIGMEAKPARSLGRARP